MGPVHLLYRQIKLQRRPAVLTFGSGTKLTARTLNASRNGKGVRLLGKDLRRFGL